MHLKLVQRTAPALALLAVLATAAMAGCASPAGSASLDGKTLVSELCGRCHPLERVKGARKDRSGWTATVGRMRSNGLVVSNEQAAAIITYLSQRDGGK